jgi:ssDNA thymidine ADP-ribosyltransferase, DarT
LVRRGGPQAAIGISEIKQRRLTERDVTCHPGTKVGEFVPFYFCPRSVMLYLIHRQNHPGLTYRGGQRPILHLEADLHEVVAWAESQDRPWAFTDRNAGSMYFQTFRDLADLGRLNWEHIASVDFRDAVVKEVKQAEFLVHGSFPWSLVRSIGVIDEAIARRVREFLVDARHQPDVQVRRAWYY